MTPRTFFSGFRTGAIAIWPLMPSAIMFGIAFGIMAGTVGLSLAEATFFSGWVYAGGAQMASLQGWDYPVPLLFVCLTTAAINSRYVLMGATLRPFMASRPAWQVYATLFFLVDANWILSLRYRPDEVDGVGLLFGSGFTMWVVWVVSTMAGSAFGQLLADPKAFGVDFMLAAFFAAAGVTFWKRARPVAPLIVSVLVAILVQKTVPGPWYILVGALAGSLAGVAVKRGRAA